jgi:hypothetical protein
LQTTFLADIAKIAFLTTHDISYAACTGSIFLTGCFWQFLLLDWIKKEPP